MTANNPTHSSGKESTDLSSVDPRRRRVISTVGTVGILAFAGCVGDTTDDTDPEPDDDDDDDTPTDDDSEPADDSDDVDDADTDPEEVEAVVGSLVEGGNFHLVVEGVTTRSEIGFMEPDDGNEFVWVGLAMKNVSDEFLHVSQLLQASVRDDEDYSYSMTFGGGEESPFSGGQFAPGEVERGGMVFEVPEDATGRKLRFDLDVSLFGGVDRAEINLEEETDVHRLEQDLAIEIHSVGDAVEFGGVEVDVREVSVETDLGSFAEAEDGHEYVIVDLSVTNNTGEEQRVSTMLQMMCKDEEGWTYQEDWAASASLDRSFDETGPLEDGETRAGQVAYEVEEGLSPLYWIFEFTLWTDGDKTFWEIR